MSLHAERIALPEVADVEDCIGHLSPRARGPASETSLWFAATLTRTQNVEAFERSVIESWFFDELPMTLTFSAACSWTLRFEDVPRAETRLRLRGAVSALSKRYPTRGQLTSGSGEPR